MRPLQLHKAEPKGVPVVSPLKLQAWELARQGMPHKEIARRMGVARVSSITKWIADVREAKHTAEALRVARAVRS